ncbi:MAG: LrgB family protein [Moraxellaceae bacterium]|jgi:putative effector of murein hydrolase|nr:LrgB family protein [Moraxellaceae bacterium]
MSALLDSPVPWLILTLGAFEGGTWLYRRLGEPVWAPPLLMALALIIGVLLVTGIDYAVYFRGNALLHFLLGPATVALAVPLYHALPRLLAAFRPLAGTLLLGTVLGAGGAMSLAWLFQLSHESILAFATRAVTTPIAIGIAEKIHAPLALAAALVGFSGVLGAALAEPLLKGVKSDVARGFALGLAAHGVGTARAFQLHPTAGAFAALGMGLNGLLTAFWLPPLVRALSGP